MNHKRRIHTYIANLGLYPQLITISVDVLEKHLISSGELGISRIHILHTDHPKTFEAINDLKNQFESRFGFQVVDPDEFYRAKGRVVTFRPFLKQGIALPDIKTPSEAVASFRLIYQTVLKEKEVGATVHLMASSGRKVTVMWALLVAQLLFTDDFDRVWDLWSTPELEMSRDLFSQNGIALENQFDLPHTNADSILFRVPVLPWSSEVVRKSQFLETLTPRETDIITCVAGDGMSKQDLEQELNIGAKAVDTHFQNIARKWEDFAGLHQVSVKPLDMMRQEFGSYFYITRLINEATRF